MPLGTIQYWLYKKSRRASVRLANSEGKSPSAFMPLEVVASPAPQARDGLVEVAVQGGATVRFGVGTDPAYVAALLKALS